LREGEAFGLTVPRVDFLRRKVHELSQTQRGQLAAERLWLLLARQAIADAQICGKPPAPAHDRD
jgi:hypothetical protein